MAITTNLGLPLIDNNTTNDVKRDMNALAEAVDASVVAAIDGAIDDVSIPDASLTIKGKVQLSDVVSSTDKTKAATPSAVKIAYDEALAAKQLGVEQKNNVVAALNSIGVTASTSETWAQLIPKISGVIRATGNATAADLLTGKTASNANGPITGTMANRGAVSQNITAQNGSYTIPAGYHNGAGVIKAIFANLTAANIRNGVNVGGVIGSLIEGLPYARGVAKTGNYRLTVTGLAFAPQIIFFYNTSFTDPRYGYFFKLEIFISGSTVGYGGIVVANGSVPTWADRRATFSTNGFDIDLNFADGAVATHWIAIGGIV